MSAQVKGNAKDSLASFVDHRLNEISGTMTLTEMALRMGLASPNYISMIRAGKVKMALARVEEFARHLGVDEKELFKMALRQHFPEEVIKLMRYAFSTDLTKTEAEILEIAEANMDVSKPLGSQLREKLVEVFRDSSTN